MTTITLSESASTTHRPAANRILAVFRLHFVNPHTVVIIPWLIMLFIFLVNYAIWWLIDANVQDAADRSDAQQGLGWSGASFYIFVYLMVVAIQAINFTFPFAQGYGVTRRDFYLGTSLAFVALAAGYAVALTVLSYIEEATDGWGLGGQMFTAVYFGTGEWYTRLATFFLILAFFFFVGAAIAAVYVRWRTNGMLIFFGLLTVLLVGLAALATFTQSWPAVGEWLVENGANGVILWSLVPTVLAGVTGYFVLRRATPRD